MYRKFVMVIYVTAEANMGMDVDIDVNIGIGGVLECGIAIKGFAPGNANVATRELVIVISFLS
jgi:hypothetical protein